MFGDEYSESMAMTIAKFMKFVGRKIVLAGSEEKSSLCNFGLKESIDSFGIVGDFAEEGSFGDVMLQDGANFFIKP